MRIGLSMFGAASLAVFAVALTNPAYGQAVQESDAAVASASNTPAEEVLAAPAATATVKQEPASAVAPASGAAAAESGSSTSPAAAEPVGPEDAASSQPITLKMATVPPPADFKVPAGYRAVKRGLDTVYCKTITPIGSRMPQTYCMSREQVEQIQRQAEMERQMLKEKARAGGTSGG